MYMNTSKEQLLYNVKKRNFKNIEFVFDPHQLFNTWKTFMNPRHLRHPRHPRTHASMPPMLTIPPMLFRGFKYNLTKYHKTRFDSKLPF